MFEKSDVEKEVRKYRKKLRQIDRLIHVDRDLTDDELEKVIQKEIIREKLAALLAGYDDEIDTTHGSVVTSSVVDSSYITTDLSDVSLTFDKDPAPSLHSTPLEDEPQKEIHNSNHGPVENLFAAEENTVDEKGDTKQGEFVTVRHRGKAHDKPDVLSSESQPVQHEKPKQKLKDTQSIEHSVTHPVKASTQKSDKNEHSKKKSGADSRETKKSAKNEWLRRTFESRELVGHNDVVTAIDTDSHHVLTGSRDTMVKVWEVSTCIELHSFGAHSATVTCVKLLSAAPSTALCEGYVKADAELKLEEEKVGISGSQDCCVKVWALISGQLMCEMYTFNAITAVDYLESEQLVVATSDGGKVQLWNALSRDLVYEVLAHEDSISALQVCGSMVYTSCVDGEVQSFQFQPETRTLRQLFRSERVRHRHGGDVIERPVHAHTCYGDVIYYGDDGMNIKALNWKEGLVHKLYNHRTDFGATHCLTVKNQHLYSTGHDLDSDQGFVHVRELPSEDYMCTLCEEGIGRIVCLACSPTHTGLHFVVSSAKQVFLWTQRKRDSYGRNGSANPVLTQYFEEFEKIPPDSEVESSDEDSDVDSFARTQSAPRRSRGGSGEKQDAQKASWWWWCTVL